MGGYSGQDGKTDITSFDRNCLHLKVNLFIFSPEKHITGIPD
jgi:hypothetical protein